MGVSGRILRGANGFVTRRAVGRAFLFKPTPEVTDILWYAFAHSVNKHGVEPHAFVGMSTHLHHDESDPFGVLPKLKQDFHRLVAQHIQRLWGWEGPVFERGDTRHAEVIGERGAVEKALYCVLNPVRAGLVATAKEWPGAMWLPGMRSYTAKKPACWFEGEHWPEEITVNFVAPGAWSGTEEEWHAEIARLVEEEERALRRERIREGRAVLGPQIVMQQRHTARPARSERRGKLNPVLATGGDGALMKVAKAALRTWRTAYREALDRWRQDKTTRFPEGSYWVVVHHGAAIAS